LQHQARQAGIEQLPASDHAVLPSRQHPDSPICVNLYIAEMYRFTRLGHAADVRRVPAALEP
jgi:hypothetical protein